MKLKDVMLAIFALGVIVFGLICIGIAVVACVHAFSYPEMTATQNILWVFESKFRTISVIGAILSYFGIMVLAK